VRSAIASLSQPAKRWRESRAGTRGKIVLHIEP
jgi:hypothetical protein